VRIFKARFVYKRYAGKVVPSFGNMYFKKKIRLFCCDAEWREKCVAVIFFVVLQVDKKGLHDKKNKPT